MNRSSQASLPITNSWSPPKSMSIESMMPSNHLILCCPFFCLQSFLASGSFPMSHLFLSGGQNIGASASVLIVNIQGWFSLGLTGLISFLFKEIKNLLQHHSSKASILQCSPFFMVQLSHPHMTTGKTTALTRRIFLSKVMFLLFNILSRFLIAFLPRSRCLLISWLQLPSTSDSGAQENKICHCFHFFPFYLPWSDGDWMAWS